MQNKILISSLCHKRHIAIIVHVVHVWWRDARKTRLTLLCAFELLRRNTYCSFEYFLQKLNNILLCPCLLFQNTLSRYITWLKYRQCHFGQNMRLERSFIKSYINTVHIYKIKHFDILCAVVLKHRFGINFCLGSTFISLPNVSNCSKMVTLQFLAFFEDKFC